MVVEARLRLRHRGCYSEELPAGLRVIHLSGGSEHCLCLLQGGSPEERERVLERLAKSFGSPPEVMERSDDRIMARCHCATGGVVPALLEKGASVIWPVLHVGGWEHLRLVMPDQEATERVRRYLQSQGELVVDRMTSGAMEQFGASVWLSSLTQVLPPRQLDALRLAIDKGYYAKPRQVTIPELAAEAGVSRSTFQEHLQKAEQRVMTLFTELIEEPRAGR